MSNLVAVSDMNVMADAMVKSNFYGFKNKDQMLAVMLVAQAEGKHPATVVQEYDIIMGRPALKSQAMLARFQLAGGKVDWHEISPTKCSGTFSHPQGGSLKVEWTIEMAKLAGLYKDNSGWTKYPEDMLRSRVVSRAVRSVFPACILGHYAVEEVQDFDPPKVKDMGMVQEVAEEIVQDGAYSFYIPNIEEPYANYHTTAEWLLAFEDILKKIALSTKYSAEEKTEKIMSLKIANDFVIDSFSPAERIRVKAIMASAGVNPAPKPSVSQEG
jgi:hypothetical protein